MFVHSVLIDRTRLTVIRRRRLEMFVVRLNAIITPAVHSAVRRGSQLIWPLTLPQDLYNIGADMLRLSTTTPDTFPQSLRLSTTLRNGTSVLEPFLAPVSRTATPSLSLTSALANGTFGTPPRYTLSTPRTATTVIDPHPPVTEVLHALLARGPMPPQFHALPMTRTTITSVPSTPLTSTTTPTTTMPVTTTTRNQHALAVSTANVELSPAVSPLFSDELEDFIASLDVVPRP